MLVTDIRPNLLSSVPARRLSAKRTRQTLLALLCVTLCAPAIAAPQPAKAIAGWVEKVVVMTPDGEIETKAKLDTGAKTSSIHGEDIERFERDGEGWVRFTLVLLDTDDEIRRIKMESEVQRNILVKDHDDPSSRRPIVSLPVCFDGREHQIHFSLADRGDFIYSVLLGRRFLNDVALVDADETFLTVSACPAGDTD